MTLQELISALTGRVGWIQYPTSFPFALTEENGRSESGRYFQDYSALVTLSNIKDTMEDAEADEEAFNVSLSNLQRAAISAVASGILREGANIEQSAAHDIIDNTAKTKPELFDEAIGLQMACSVIELMQHSARSNYTERIGKESSALLFRELNGAYTDNGVPVSTGLKNRLSRELTRLKKILFPKAKPFIATPKFT